MVIRIYQAWSVRCKSFKVIRLASCRRGGPHSFDFSSSQLMSKSPGHSYRGVGLDYVTVEFASVRSCPEIVLSVLVYVYIYIHI